MAEILQLLVDPGAIKYQVRFSLYCTLPHLRCDRLGELDKNCHRPQTFEPKNQYCIPCGR